MYFQEFNMADCKLSRVYFLYNNKISVYGSEIWKGEGIQFIWLIILYGFELFFKSCKKTILVGLYIFTPVM